MARKAANGNSKPKHGGTAKSGGQAKASHTKAAPARTAPMKAARASWRGMVRFGLVSFPVEAFNAHSQEESQLHFHQLHAECHSRIRYQKTCPIHGPVPNDEIVSGYEYNKGQYVEIDPNELDKLHSQEQRTLTIDTFISPDELDLVYFDGRMYYLSADGDQAREPYAVFLEALQKENRWGIGQVVFSGKEQLVVVRPHEDALHMALLNYAAAIRDPHKTIVPLAQVKDMEKKVKLAEQLIENWSQTKFDFADYQDQYLEQVKAIIDAKVEGRELVMPEVEEEPAVINLMDALRKSVHAQQKASAGSKNKDGRASAAKPHSGRNRSHTGKRRHAS